MSFTAFSRKTEASAGKRRAGRVEKRIADIGTFLLKAAIWLRLFVGIFDFIVLRKYLLR